MTTKFGRSLLVSLAVIALLAAPALAVSPTASGTLTVTATVNSSINLIFNSDPSGVVLSGTGTNAATLAFGTIQAYGGTPPTGVTITPGASSFSASTPFQVQVSLANSSSANYTLTAQLGTADATNTWKVNSVTVTSASPATITATGSYGSSTSYPLALTIPYSEAAGSISNTLAFVATAN